MNLHSPCWRQTPWRVDCPEATYWCTTARPLSLTAVPFSVFPGPGNPDVITQSANSRTARLALFGYSAGAALFAVTGVFLAFISFGAPSLSVNMLPLAGFGPAGVLLWLRRLARTMLLRSRSLIHSPQTGCITFTSHAGPGSRAESITTPLENCSLLMHPLRIKEQFGPFELPEQAHEEILCRHVAAIVHLDGDERKERFCIACFESVPMMELYIRSLPAWLRDRYAGEGPPITAPAPSGWPKPQPTRRQRLISRGLCPRCEYDLTQIGADTCPECGLELPTIFAAQA